MGSANPRCQGAEQREPTSNKEPDSEQMLRHPAVLERQIDAEQEKDRESDKPERGVERQSHPYERSRRGGDHRNRERLMDRMKQHVCDWNTDQRPHHVM